MKNHQSSEEKIEKKAPYVQPTLKKIDLKMDEILNVGCRTSGSTGTGNTDNPLTCAADPSCAL